jgi:hypothetical protein
VSTIATGVPLWATVSVDPSLGSSFIRKTWRELMNPWSRSMQTAAPRCVSSA